MTWVEPRGTNNSPDCLPEFLDHVADGPSSGPDTGTINCVPDFLRRERFHRLKLGQAKSKNIAVKVGCRRADELAKLLLSALRSVGKSHREWDRSLCPRIARRLSAADCLPSRMIRPPLRRRWRGIVLVPLARRETKKNGPQECQKGRLPGLVVPQMTDSPGGTSVSEKSVKQPKPSTKSPQCASPVPLRQQIDATAFGLLQKRPEFGLVGRTNDLARPSVLIEIGENAAKPGHFLGIAADGIDQTQEITEEVLGTAPNIEVETAGGCEGRVARPRQRVFEPRRGRATPRASRGWCWDA